MDIKKVGVVGCGAMGSGIAQVCARVGYQVMVSDINEAALDKGISSVGSRLARDVEKGRLSPEDRDNTLQRLKGTVDKNDFSDCDLMIEAVFENMEIKRKTFCEIDEICPEHTILATNTSCLSVINIATATKRPEKVLGLHFLNPVPVIKLLEAIKTIATSDETLETGVEFGKSLGKTLVVAKDTPGFIVNRLMTPFIHNAIRMLESGIASKEDIDTAVKLGLNHPMGPLELIDLLGIDIDYDVSCDMYERLKEVEYAPPLLVQQMVAAGWLGRKTGKGFYDYQ